MAADDWHRVVFRLVVEKLRDAGLARKGGLRMSCVCVSSGGESFVHGARRWCIGHCVAAVDLHGGVLVGVMAEATFSSCRCKRKRF
jgi:hypothetical protein